MKKFNEEIEDLRNYKSKLTENKTKSNYINEMEVDRK